MTAKPICAYCDRTPAEIDEYIENAAAVDMKPDDYVRADEGTFNPENGHFACTECYIKIGMPVTSTGWVAP